MRTLVDTNGMFAIWNVCFESHKCVCLPCQKPLCLLWPAVATSNITHYANGHISRAFPTFCIMFTLCSSGLDYSWPSLGNLVCQIKKTGNWYKILSAAERHLWTLLVLQQMVAWDLLCLWCSLLNLTIVLLNRMFSHFIVSLESSYLD